MEAVILNGMHSGDPFVPAVQELLVKTLEGEQWEVEAHVLNEHDLNYCQGCFGCWLQTPGRCVMHDADELAEATATSELVIYLTPVTFGGYSSVLKTLVDRLIFLVLPFFMIVNGETHHVPRYEVRPNLLVVGTMPEAEPEQEATFIELAERNAINWSAEKHAAGVVLETEEPGAQAHRVKSLLGRVGVVS